MLRKMLGAVLKLCVVGAVAAAVTEVLRRRRRQPDYPSSGVWPPLDLNGDRSTASGSGVTEDAVAEDAASEDAVAEAREVADLERELTVKATELATDLATAGPEGATRAWVGPDGGACPASHPVKAKLSSGVFHLPGMIYYDRTNPDRCYTDATAAEADGLRQAKR